MFIVGCQKCGEIKVIAGNPDLSGTTRVMWTCSHCGAGQVLELALNRDARRGDLHKIICGFALNKTMSKFTAGNSYLTDHYHSDLSNDS